MVNRDEVLLKKLQQELGIEYSDKDIKNNPKGVINEILHSWMPIEITVFKCIIE